MTNTYPRETTEFVEVNVTIDGDPITTFDVAVIPYGQRPTTSWAPATELDGKHGVLLTGLDPGAYTVWARVTDNPEAPVVECQPPITIT